MARPKALLHDLEAVRQAGIDTVISLLEPQEATLLDLGAQGEICAQSGLTFLNHPIRDMHLPELEGFAAFASQIASKLRNGEHVAIHCRASIGRSGMLACTVLGHFGYDPDAAIAHVSAQRGERIPDTQAQAAFIRTMSATQAP